MNNLGTHAAFSLAGLALALALLLFFPSGDAAYWQAWVYLCIFIGSSILTTRSLLRNDPQLLQRRMRGGPTAEKLPKQKIIMTFTSLGFIGLLVVPALDLRWQWSSMPWEISLVGDLLVAIGLALIAWIYRVNSFAAATIDVFKGQQVVSTGPYAVVRHPMYASALLYLLGTPLALGSYWGLLPLALTFPFLIWRLLDEERFLAANLPGYTSYQNKVRKRLVPLLW
jgi:protein-S-isoprenylcysteine O-methyltransferase Ste14